MSSLELRTFYSYFGYKCVEVVETEPETIEHVVYSIVAATLQAPIIKALHEHVDTCTVCVRVRECTLPRCDEAISLWNMISSKGMVALG